MSNIKFQSTKHSLVIGSLEFIWSLGFGYRMLLIHKDSLMNICIITSSFPSRPDDIVQAPFLINFIEGLKKRDHQSSSLHRTGKE